VPQRWTDISADPNCKAVRDQRAQVIDTAWAFPIDDRIAYLASLAKGKNVLDVGVVDHWVEHRAPEEWLHGAIVEAAESCLGVDILEDEVKKLQERGLNVMTRDVTAEPLDQTFDVMICGELIEHLGNPGGIFRAASAMLAPGGRMALTTPNPFFWGRMRDSLLGRTRENVDHVTYLFPSGIVELAEREGLILERYRGVISSSFRKARKRFKLKLSQWRWGERAVDQYCRAYIYEIVKPA
jgi:cyclopropane fatty-acyl-phospholipid synthase-like methyltransferase